MNGSIQKKRSISFNKQYKSKCPKSSVQETDTLDKGTE